MKRSFGTSIVCWVAMALACSILGGQLSAAEQEEAIALDSDKGATAAPEVEEGEETQPSKLPFRVSVSVREGYDSNTLTSSFEEHESFFTSVYADILGKWGDEDRFSLDLSMGGGFSYYYDRPEDDLDWYGNARIGLAYKPSERMLLSWRSYFAYEAEPRFDMPLSQMRRSGDYFYMNQDVSAAYQWTERFSTVTRYNLVGVLYDEANTSELEDRLEHYIGQELRYLVRPETTVLGEYRFGIIDYFDAPRDSLSHYLLAGVDHVFNPKSKASLRAGAEYRDWDEQGEGEWTPYAELNLTYAYAENSSVSWVNRYAQEQSDILSLTDRQTFRTGLTWKHELAGKLVASLAFYYLFNQYDQVGDGAGGADFDEHALDLSAHLEYFITRVLSIDLGYLFTTVLSDEDFREYDRHRVYLGLKASF